MLYISFKATKVYNPNHLVFYYSRYGLICSSFARDISPNNDRRNSKRAVAAVESLSKKFGPFE